MYVTPWGKLDGISGSTVSFQPRRVHPPTSLLAILLPSLGLHRQADGHRGHHILIDCSHHGCVSLVLFAGIRCLYRVQNNYSSGFRAGDLVVTTGLTLGILKENIRIDFVGIQD